MLRLSLAVFLLAITAIVASCANGNKSDPCKQALQRLVDDCGYSISGLDSLQTNCTGQAACVAKCLEESPCDDISQNSGEFATCVSACKK